MTNTNLMRSLLRSVLLIVMAALMLAGMTGCALVERTSIPLPYGIKPGMTISEMKAQAVAGGLRYDRGQYEFGFHTLFFEPSTVLGEKTKFSTVELVDDGRIMVDHYFSEGSQYGQDNPGPRYHRVREQLIAAYGMPAMESSGRCEWYSGCYRLYLAYLSNNMSEATLVLGYSYRPD